MSLSTSESDGLCDPNSFLSSQLSSIADMDDTPRAKRFLKRQIVAEAKRQTESNSAQKAPKRRRRHKSPNPEHSYSNWRVDRVVKAAIANQHETQQIVDVFSEPFNTVKEVGKLGLPIEIIQQIVRFVCDDYDPASFRILAVVLQDLLHMALASPDFLAVLPYAYKYLESSKLLPPPRYAPTPEPKWDRLIRDPKSYWTHELQEFAECLEFEIRPYLDRFESGECHLFA